MSSESPQIEAPGKDAEKSVEQEARALVRTLSALPELSMRVRWLGEALTGDKIRCQAKVLDRVAGWAQSTDEGAREAILSLAMLLSERHDSGFIWALRDEAKASALLNLERLVRASASGEEENEIHVHLEPRVPDYGKGRELSVGERRTLARRPSRDQMERLLLDPHPLVIEQLLSCPQVTEPDMISIASRRPAHLDALLLLSKSAKWMSRRRIRMSVILNPGTPLGIALPFVTTCPREDLHLIAAATTINATLRTVARELYEKLPPVAEAKIHRHHQ